MKTNNGIILDGNDLSTPEISNAGFHNSIYRGKSIGSYLTDGSLWIRISSGKFEDLFVGDYFDVTIDDISTRMLIAGFDIFLKVGDPADNATILTRHHAVIIPVKHLTDAAMSTLDDTTPLPYINTEMFTDILPSKAASLGNMIGESHVLSSTEYLTSSIDENAKNCMRPEIIGASNGCVYMTSKANLLSETELYGFMSFSSSGYENGMRCYGQLPLFRLNPRLIVSSTTLDSGYWLRNVASKKTYCLCYNSGEATRDIRTAIHGVRPRFIIG